MDYPSVSIILVNYKSQKYAEEAINSLLEQDYPKDKLQIIVVDNASFDGSAEFIKQKYGKHIEFIESKKNLGFAGGNNLGYKYATGEMILLFNIDAIAPKDLIKKMVFEASKNERTAIVGAFDFLPGIDLEKVEIKGSYSITLLGSNTPREKKGEKSLAAGGFCLLVKRDKIEHLFDEDYFLYFEETKLGWECNAKGYDVVIPQTCRVWHYGSVTTGKVSSIKTFYSERNRIMTLLTCFQKITLLKLLPLALVDGAFRFVFYLFKPKLFISFIKALFWNITHIGLILKKRSEFSKIRRLKDKELFHLFSYKLFPEHRSLKLKLFWRILDFFTRTYLSLVGIKTYDMY